MFSPLFLGCLSGCPTTWWCLETHCSPNLDPDVSCQCDIRECTCPEGRLGTAFEAVSEEDFGIWVFSVHKKEPTLDIIFLSEFHRGGNKSCVVFNTVVVLSIDSILLDLFRHRFSPFNSLTLLPFRSSRVWPESSVS